MNDYLDSELSGSGDAPIVEKVTTGAAVSRAGRPMMRRTRSIGSGMAKHTDPSKLDITPTDGEI